MHNSWVSKTAKSATFLNSQAAAQMYTTLWLLTLQTLYYSLKKTKFVKKILIIYPSSYLHISQIAQNSQMWTILPSKFYKSARITELLYKFIKLLSPLALRLSLGDCCSCQRILQVFQHITCLPDKCFCLGLPYSLNKFKLLQVNWLNQI